MISTRFYCCLLIVSFAFILSELVCNFVPHESMNGLFRDMINLYPPQGSSAVQKLWPCCGAPCKSWLQPWPALPGSWLQSTVSLESINKVREVWRQTERRTERTEKPKQERNKDTGRLIRQRKNTIQTSIKRSQT